jgi:hypothetical protein
MSEQSGVGGTELEELKCRLRSLDDNDLAGLVSGLNALGEDSAGVTVTPVTAQLDVSSDDPDAQELIDLFNHLLVRSHAVIKRYELLRQTILLGRLHADMTTVTAEKVSPHHV